MNIEPPEWQNLKKLFTLRTVAWIFGIVFLIVGITSLFSNPLAGIFSLLLAAALLPPVVTFVQKKWNRAITRKQRFWTIVVFLILLVCVIPHAPSQQTPATTTAPLASMPQSAQGKLEAEVAPQLQNTGIQTSLMDTSIQEENDPTRPKGAEYVTIDVNTGDFLDDNSFITSTGELSSTLFQTVIPTDQNFYDILIRYYGQTTDQYGNATSSMLMSYGIDRPLYNKINWSGLSSIGNDIHLCAFLRENFNTMSQADQENSYIGCTVIPSDLRSAENTIESSNSQYSDIPHYGS